ncbi:MAG: carboxypeptidase-like regulatory domain-containing protein [Candidatus Sulfotelmatobacter sp.]|jgi:protocatechuate 3,4-dioxygenase beta subunit
MSSRLVAAAFVIVAIFSSLTARAQTGCLTGSVVDNAGEPVEGIRITMGDNVWTTAQISPEPKSDESGQFRIEGIPPGTYKANAFNDQLGYPGIWWPVRDVSITATSVCANITFNVRSRAAKLKLTVTDAATSKPVHDIVLDVFPGDKPGLWLPVEPLLSYGLPPQVPSLTRLRIVVAAKGYSSAVFTFPSLAAGETHEIIAKLSPKGLGCITGIAIDENYSPVMAATISPRFMSAGYGGGLAPAKTDADGKFAFDNLRPGDYTLWPEKESDGFSGNWSGWRGQVELQKVTVTPGAACEDVTINMGARGALMKVRAMDGATHEYLTDMQVILRNLGDPPQTASIFGAPREFLVPSRTVFTLQVLAPGYKNSERIQVEPLSPGEKQELTVPMRRETAAAPAVLNESSK